jgi:hypothetical protein
MVAAVIKVVENAVRTGKEACLLSSWWIGRLPPGHCDSPFNNFAMLDSDTRVRNDNDE